MDLRTRLARTLRTYRYEPMSSEQVADVLLSLPGIAIVELPEPNSTTANTAEWHALDHDRVRRNVSAVLWDGHAFDAEEVRALAAALLAAADAAEAADE